MNCYNCKNAVEKSVIDQLNSDCIKYKLKFKEEKKYILCYCCNKLRLSYQ